MLARQQLQRTEVRAPFDGVVSERKVSPGDTAQVGKELLKVIDPTSMRFEAMVSADHMGEVKPGQAVDFRVNGYGEQRVHGQGAARESRRPTPPRARWRCWWTSWASKQPKLAGLYAEGRLETESAREPHHSRLGDRARRRQGSAFRVPDGKLQKVPLAIAERDPRTGEYVVASGLAEGDRVIRYPTALAEGRPGGAGGRGAQVLDGGVEVSADAPFRFQHQAAGRRPSSSSSR